MKKQIINISPIQSAKVIALMYFLISLPFVGLMAISFPLSPAPQPGIGFLVLFPFVYLIFGFIFTALGAWFYNLVAKRVGGIEYTATSTENT